MKSQRLLRSLPLFSGATALLVALGYTALTLQNQPPPGTPIAFTFCIHADAKIPIAPFIGRDYNLIITSEDRRRTKGAAAPAGQGILYVAKGQKAQTLGVTLYTPWVVQNGAPKRDDVFRDIARMVNLNLLPKQAAEALRNPQPVQQQLELATSAQLPPTLPDELGKDPAAAAARLAQINLKDLIVSSATDAQRQAIDPAMLEFVEQKVKIQVGGQPFVPTKGERLWIDVVVEIGHTKPVQVDRADLQRLQRLMSKAAQNVEEPPELKERDRKLIRRMLQKVESVVITITPPAQPADAPTL